MTHLWVSYCVNEEFIIPKGIDLDDTSKVKSYGVKHSVLTITFVDGTSLQLQSKGMNYNTAEPESYHQEEAELCCCSDDESDDDPVEEPPVKGVCECCESGRSATKVSGTLVCEQCNNFECAICGIPFDELYQAWNNPSYDEENDESERVGEWRGKAYVEWNEDSKKCICEKCKDEL